jgi:hypothetical protein
MLRTFGEQAVEKDFVQTLGREDGLGDPLRRVLVEIDIGGAKGQIEIRQDGLGREQARYAKRAVVSYR